MLFFYFLQHRSSLFKLTKAGTMHPDNFFIVKNGNGCPEIFKNIFTAADPQFCFPVAEGNNMNSRLVNKQKEMVEDDQKENFFVCKTKRNFLKTGICFKSAFTKKSCKFCK